MVTQLLFNRCRSVLRRTLLLSLFLALALPALAQNESKFSISTQMFMKELKGEISTDPAPLRARAKQLGLHPVNEDAKYERFIAKPDTINGQVYMSAFVRIDDASAIGELEALGVIVQEQFLEGKLLTTLIPIEQIDAVAAIAKVNRVNAATMMRKSTNTARQRTNVDDVLTFSADAQSAGLPNAFDGSGVVLGVIDTGIDFNHIAFKDKSGNSRIKQAYVYNGNSASTYTGSQITSTLTDDKAEDHGTHTSSTAGGSSVTVSGTNVTVTDNHANATYGGMAPGADLYLAGINGLTDTYLTNAVNNMVTYANNQNKPLVVSNSWGSQLGPHDGTGDVADIYNSLFGDSHPNRVALFAASNDAGKSPASEAGGFHVRGTSSSASPLGSILRCHYYSDTDNGFMYNGIVTNAWFRSTVSNITVKILVLNSSTGAKVAETTVTPTANGATVSGLSSYYSGSLYVFKDYISAAGKTQVMIYGNSFQSRSYNSSYQSNYTLAVQIYPNSGSAVLDMWGGNTGYFTSHLTTSGYSWTNGSDDMCVSDEAMIANVISIGAYATKNGGMNTSYTIGDIADFSSYATASESPDGNQYPWITAPGARLIAGVNHNHTSSVDSYSYYGSTFNADLVVNSSTNPYAYMEGTSMATPTAAGIVALWLQASLDENAKSEYKNLTVNKVKNLMAQTAIHDTYTDTGSNHTHFGNGKIDALAGIEEILESNTPRITATPSSVTFPDTYVGDAAATQTFTVKGANLEGNITATLSDASGVFAISPTSITKAQAEASAGKDITVTFTPRGAANYTGTVTLASSNAESVTVTLTAKGLVHTPAITANPTTVAFGNRNAGGSYTSTFTVTGQYLNGNISLAKSGASVFSIDKTSITKNNDGTASATVTVTFAPTANVDQNYTGTVTLTSSNATNVTVSLTGHGVYNSPVIAANPSSLSFTGNSGSTYTKTVTVTGSNLQGNITAAITDDANGFYSVSPTSFNAASQTVTVTWHPTAGGTSTANLVLTTTGVGANTVTVPLSGTAQGPQITANPTSVTFTDAYATRTYTQTVNVTGTNLSQNITASITGANVYSIDRTSLGTSGGTITVTYAPTAAGQTTATLALSSTGASTVTVPINGTAQAATPTLMVTPTNLTFSSDLTNSDTQSFAVTGRFISSDVTLTLTDPSGVFTLGTATIPAASISEETAVNVNVTFQSAAEGTFNGSVTVASTGAESQTVTLNAEANDGGTASDNYLDIAKYATIDEVGWRTALVNNLYRYTEYDNEETAWLTLPVYGAFVGARYATNSSTIGSGHPQQWIECSLGNSNTYGGTTWNANNKTLGSSTYFTSATARAIGYNSRNNTEIRTVSFYVTNTTAVQLYGIGRSGVSSSYPASLKVYECTKNANGTLTAAATATKSQTSSSTNSYNISADGLDVTKIYKVEVSNYRGYMYEIGFCTPLNKPMLKAMPTDLSLRAAPGETTTATFNVKGKKLSNNVSVTLTDANGVFAVAPTSISIADAQNANGTDVTVTFNAPATEGTFTGTVTLTSGTLTATVNLNARCADGGTASDNYLNIAKYATIDDAGATVSGMQTIYKYTEYSADDCAWLTLSNYGAKQTDANQNWLTSSSLSQYNNSWSASDIFPGQDAYFGSSQAYSVYGSGNQTFYVTNCTQVKALVKDGSSSKATLAIYECTENADGTLTASATATDSQQGGASGTAVITSATLDASKIYKVQLTGGGSYPDILEIGFKTPLTKPVLAASPTELDFIAEPGETLTQTFAVTGSRLTEAVTVTLTDPNSVYSVSPTTISAADAMAGSTVTVTFNAPQAEGSYRAMVTLTSGTASANVGVYGSVGEKGSAYSRYLDIAKYQSIGTGEWYKGLFTDGDVFEEVYKYNDVDYLADQVAWLTIPDPLAYHAWIYNDQNWCGLNSAANPWWYGHTWEATDVFQGNTYFYGDGNSAYMVGPNVSSSSDVATNTSMFYTYYRVTNCTQVKTHGYNGTGPTSSYPALMLIYELTENADGTLTMGNNAVDQQTNSTTSSSYTLTSATLDASKIYFVAVGGYRNFNYEVAFRTPIPTVTLAELATDGNEGQYYILEDNNVEFVRLSADGKKLFCKDNNGFASPSVPESGQIDYVMEKTDLMTREAWDQSNWVALTLDGSGEWTSNDLASYSNKKLTHVLGRLTDKANPNLLISTTSKPTAGTAVTAPYMSQPNNYVTCNFAETVQLGSDGNYYFFVAPKPMEVVQVNWAMWDGENSRFVVVPSVGASNTFNLDGSFYINMSEYSGTKPTLQHNAIYNFVALVKQENATASSLQSRRRDPAQAPTGYMVYPISGLETPVGAYDGNIVTGLADVRAIAPAVEVARFNAAGQRVDADYRGIVIIRMSDGTARKVVVE